MRKLIFAGVTLALLGFCLETLRRSRLRRRGQASASATDRWEDEGGALRGRPG